MPTDETVQENEREREVKLTISIGKKLDEMRKQGLTATPEFEKLSDDWETVSQGIITGDVLADVCKRSKDHDGSAS